MKAKYEKPALEVVDLTLNTAIAACNSAAPKTLTLDESCQFPEEDYPNPFTEDSESCPNKVIGYCYFSAKTMIFNS